MKLNNDLIYRLVIDNKMISRITVTRIIYNSKEVMSTNPYYKQAKDN